MIADAEDRRRAIDGMDRSQVVEASAGTGKTATLVGRILQLVLRRNVRLSRICAITFTEKAAGELKIKLRRAFEEALRKSDDGGIRAGEALLDLETAAISTIHAFAVSLLKERPVEAGLDPYFTALDETRGNLFFQEVWESWIDQAIRQRSPILEAVLRQGLKLELLRDLAGSLRLHEWALRGLQLPPPPTRESLRARANALIGEGERLAAFCRNDQDKLLDLLHSALGYLAAPGDDMSPPGKPGNRGAAKDWDGGKARVAEVRGYIEQVCRLAELWQANPSQSLLDRVVRWLRDEFLAEWRARKRAAALLDFDDQLAAAGNLLRTSKAARRQFQTQFSVLLVDEFQDTDRLQLEMVLLLSCTDLEETELPRLRPAPGRLFIVGDPKQSIYRFRGADIETYQEVLQPANLARLGMEKVQLTTNFRSVPSILKFVDQAFAPIMKASEGCAYQPDYLAFGEAGHRREETSPPSVHILAEPHPDGGLAGSGDNYFRIESERIAKLIRHMRGNLRWKVQEKSPASPRMEEWRAPEYRDIAVLLPVLTEADLLEESLRAEDIPYVLEGGKFYYARSEVQSALAALRAIANPNDAVALYAALKSVFFGLSDEDLARHRMSGGELDYRSAIGQESPLFRPFRILGALHKMRHSRLPSETFETLLHSTGAREVLSVRGMQSLGNLGKLSRTLRGLESHATFSEAVEILEAMDAEGMAESESRLMEDHSDAVRVMSIHRAKGLDFPIVIIAGLGKGTSHRSESLLTDLHSRKIFAVRAGSAESGLRTAEWESLLAEDKQREKAELIRLLYVALTRARDHLVVGAHTKGSGSNDGAALAPEFTSTRLEPLGGFLADTLASERPCARKVDLESIENRASPRVRTTEPAHLDVRKRLREEYEELDRLMEAVSGPPALVPEGPEPGRAVRFGLAFHEMMEIIDFQEPGEIGAIAREAAARHRLEPGSAPELAATAALALESSLLGRARRVASDGGRVWRELQFVEPVGPGQGPPGAAGGKIDLLFEEGNGYVLVDYKTDQAPTGRPIDPGSFIAAHAPQIRRYVTSLARLGVHVKEAYLLLARSGVELPVPLSLPGEA